MDEGFVEKLPGGHGDGDTAPLMLVNEPAKRLAGHRLKWNTEQAANQDTETDKLTQKVKVANFLTRQQNRLITKDIENDAADSRSYGLCQNQKHATTK